jgi:hypothetical protein
MLPDECLDRIVQQRDTVPEDITFSGKYQKGPLPDGKGRRDLQLMDLVMQPVGFDAMGI